MNTKNIFYWLVLLIITISCNKSNNYNAVEIKPIPAEEEISVVFIVADGLGIGQITAAYTENRGLNLARFPYSGLMLTQTTDKYVTESGASTTAMFYGFKTKYGYQGIDAYQNIHPGLNSMLKENKYQTAIITSSFITDATLASFYRHGTDRYEHEKIAMDYISNYPDFCIAGGSIHFNERSDGINLLDSLTKKGVNLFYDYSDISNIQTLPSMGLLYPGRPPYLSDGRTDFLKNGSLKALELFEGQNFFMLLEAALIDLGGHDMNIDRQIEETLELDELAGIMLDYAKSKDNILVLVVSDHEGGGLSLMQGDGMNYIADYANDEHSGNMVAVFAYGPGADKFTGIMDNTDIYYKLLEILKLNSSVQ